MNFEKFLIDAEGNVIKHYRSKATPEEVAVEIEALLATMERTSSGN